MTIEEVKTVLHGKFPSLSIVTIRKLNDGFAVRMVPTEYKDRADEVCTDSIHIDNNGNIRTYNPIVMEE